MEWNVYPALEPDEKRTNYIMCSLTSKNNPFCTGVLIKHSKKTSLAFSSRNVITKKIETTGFFSLSPEHNSSHLMSLDVFVKNCFNQLI